ncbi:MAG: LLM class flavin-dependent oxidoreductase [Thermomicrobiales bacterium]|nr:LLM class flavin-dependent oxidoreductase [Thermomicrobiales bacterium]
MKIGLVVPIAGTSESAPPRYAEIRRTAQQAETLGFDSIWLFDHLLYRFDGQPTGIWEAWTMLAALAEATERVELGTLVICTAFRNPAVLAKMTDAVDEVSGGRLILGLGAGWHKPEFTAFGLPFDHLAGRFEEALEIITPLVRTGAVDFCGEYSQAPDCLNLPRGPRPDGPPILIASAGPRMLRLTARFADSWNTAWLGAPDELPARRAKLDAACAEVDRDPKTLATTVGVIIALPDLGADAAMAADPAKALSGDAAALAEGFRAYASLDVAHVICDVFPRTSEAIARVAEAARMVRGI